MLERWRPGNELPEKSDNERFAVYVALDNGDVKLADWVSWTECTSEYHATTGVYLGQYPQDGDAYYSTDDGYEIRRSTIHDDDRWCISFDGEDKTERTFVVGWIEALKSVPEHPNAAQIFQTHSQ